MTDFEEDMMPRNICGNCLATSTRANPVRFDERSGRRLCQECEPHPMVPRWIKWTRENEKRGKDLTERAA